MADSSNTFTSMQPLMKDVYKAEAKKLSPQKAYFKKLKEKIKKGK